MPKAPRCKHDNPMTGENACPECAPIYVRGRADERESIVAWLRDDLHQLADGWAGVDDTADRFADIISCGDHLPK
jgi:hypothetical protein